MNSSLKTIRFSLFLICLSTIAHAQDDVIRLDTDFVKVPVSVLDKQGRFIGKLKKGDFKLLENGVEQEISFFESTETPFTVMLLADVSGSMKPFMPQLGRALDTFIDQLRPDDNIIVATISDWGSTDIRVAPTRKKDYTAPKPPPQRLGTPPWPSRTMTSDSIDDAIKYMKKLKGRRAIILFGDGDPSGRFATPSSNLRDAEEQEATFYTIRYGDYPAACVVDNQMLMNDALNPRSRDASEIIKRRDITLTGNICWVQKREIPKLIDQVDAHFLGLAEKTGGRGFKIKDINSLAETFDRIIEELGKTYTLGYEPKTPGNDGERRKITVKTNISNVAVRSRNEVIFKKSGK